MALISRAEMMVIIKVKTILAIMVVLVLAIQQLLLKKKKTIGHLLEVKPVKVTFFINGITAMKNAMRILVRTLKMLI
ncbi:MAG: hypothetical protein SPI53_05340 [Erysipelotrichaceae bacterium]|nr:hypothetical protein [Erysipelotrichaceae bacterium]